MAYSASASDFSEFSVEEVVEYLEDKDVGAEVLDNFKTNLVNGEAFMILEEEDLKELAPLIGERTILRQILRTIKKQVCWLLILVTDCIHAAWFQELCKNSPEDVCAVTSITKAVIPHRKNVKV